MPGGLPGGDVEASIWLVHKHEIKCKSSLAKRGKLHLVIANCWLNAKLIARKTLLLITYCANWLNQYLFKFFSTFKDDNLTSTGGIKTNVTVWLIMWSRGSTFSRAVFNVIIIRSAFITNIVPHILRKFFEGSPALSLRPESTHPDRWKRKFYQRKHGTDSRCTHITLFNLCKLTCRLVSTCREFEPSVVFLRRLK